MGQPILELLNQDSWVEIYDQTRTAQPASDQGGYIRIPAFEVSSLNKNIFAIRCTSTTAKSTWQRAGNLIQKISIPIVGVNSSLVEIVSYSIKLNRIRLLFFKSYTNSFSLTLESVYWLRDLRLTLWAYQGLESDSTEVMITNLASSLNQIKLKIDAL